MLRAIARSSCGRPLMALPDGVAILSSIRDRSGRITDFRYEYANEALAVRLGLSPGQLIGKQMLKLFPAEFESGVFADCCELVEGAELLAREDVAFREEYGVRRISLGLDLHAAKLGDGVVLVSSPIVARTQADAISAQLAAIVDSSDDAVISMTLDGQVVSWNRGSERIYGYTAEDAVGAQHLVPGSARSRGRDSRDSRAGWSRRAGRSLRDRPPKQESEV